MTKKRTIASHIQYRADIDGLRAIAVLSVVAFHAFPSWMKGGFIGVDIFFVISGFLISAIIFQNLNSGTFHLREFYTRRINRIFPALLLVLIASYTFGWFALLDEEYKQLGKHIAAGAGFISNLVLSNEAGYFDNAAETKPLIHLWSLGIEEQFYLVWPLFLWFAWKLNFNLLIIIIAAISFYLNINAMNTDIVSTFYSPQTRFWELLCGSLLAWASLCKEDTFAIIETKLGWIASFSDYKNTRLNRKTLSTICSIIGFLCLTFGFCYISNQFKFPGFWALIPVLGTVSIILSGPGAWFNRAILSNKLVVWFGLISFPLYLWHWPLLSFARIVESETPSYFIRISAVIVAIVLAWLTYKFVEHPIRSRKNSKLTVVGLVALMITIGAFGYHVFKKNGLSFRQASKAHYLIEGLGEDDPTLHSECMKKYGLRDKIRYCQVSTSKKPNIAIIGDSHAAALYRAMSDKLKLENLGVLNLGGRLFLDVATYPNGSKEEIEIYQGGIKATEFVAQETSIDTLIMVSRGPFYLKDDWNFYLISDPSITDRKKVWEIAMRKTLDKFVGVKKTIIFVLDNPEINFDPYSCLSRPLRLTHKEKPCVTSRSQFNLRNKEYRTLVFSVLKDYPTVKIFDPTKYFCDDVVCRAKINGNVLYSDSNHLSYAGAKLLSNGLIQLIKKPQIVT